MNDGSFVVETEFVSGSCDVDEKIEVPGASIYKLVIPFEDGTQQISPQILSRSILRRSTGIFFIKIVMDCAYRTG